MTKTLTNKKEKKVNINHRLSDTAVDQNERLRRQFQQVFGTSSSSSTFERTVEGKIEEGSALCGNDVDSRYIISIFYADDVCHSL